MRRIIKEYFTWIIIVLFSCQSNAQIEINNELKAGVSTDNITPPIGYLVHKTPSIGVFDSLRIKTIVLEQGSCKVAMIFADLFYIPEELSTLVRKRASEKSGIPFSNICLAATHTHNDPTCYTEITEYVRKLESGSLSQTDDGSYAKVLIDKLVNSVIQSEKKLKSITFSSGGIEIDNVAYNRRHLLRDGTVIMNGGFLNPNIIRTVGPVDPEFGVILFNTKNEKKPYASLSTFAIQLASVGDNKNFSGDFPYFLEEKLREQFDNEFISLFGEGTSADTNHFDIEQSGPQTGYPEYPQKIGNKLGESLLNNISKLEQNNPNLKFINKIVDVPLQTYSNMDLKWAENNKESKYPFLVKARIQKILSLKKLREKYGDNLPLEIQVIQLSNETAIVTLPGQIFVELGLEIKKQSPYNTTLVITLANSHEETIPVRKAYSEGSYEIIYSLVESGGGEKLVAEATALLKKLKAEAN